MEVKKIKILDEISQEAAVTITDGMYEIVCFCQPLDCEVGDTITDIPYSFLTKNIRRSKGSSYAIHKNSNDFSYAFEAKVMDSENLIVCIGNIKIKLDSNIPNDIKAGEFIAFSCFRIDI